MANIKDILANSMKATCGVMEREVSVPRAKTAHTIRELKDEGFHVIGTSHGKTQKKKVWFIRAGGF